MNDTPVKVLLIEDNPGDARLIQEALADASSGEPIVSTFDLEWADRLSNGLERLMEGDIDVVLLDLSLPDSQSLDTFARVRAQAPDLPIVVLTGLDDEVFALQAVREGAQDYLVKGRVDSSVLSRALRYAIERQRTEVALLRRNNELALLNRLGQDLAATFELHQIAERLLQAVTETIDVKGISIWLLGEERQDYLTCKAALPSYLSKVLVDLRLTAGQGIAGWVAQNEESAIVPNVRDDPRFTPIVDQMTGFRTQSVLAVPLRARGRVIGVLEMVNKRGGEFDRDDLSLVETLAASAAIAIDNARLVEALRQHADELEARNRELDAFAHTAAHDLKNPLARIIGYSEVLKHYVPVPDHEAEQYLDLIEQNGHKMSSIIDELLLLASVRQLQEVEIEPLEMVSIVAEAQRHLVHMFEERSAEIILRKEWPVALGYAPWVEAVWVNYISNAIKYGGEPPRVELGATAQGDRTVRFWVRDNGPGLTHEEQARLFIPFERLDRVRATGHGLGLSIVLHIVEKLGGQVGVESQVGLGSVFSFTLPAANQ